MRGLCKSTTVLVATLTWAAAAQGQSLQPQQPTSSSAIDTFQPTPPGDVFSAVPGPYIGGNAVLRAALALDHADKPLVLFMDGKRSALISHQTLLHTSASFAFADRALFSVSMPVALSQGGDDPDIGNARLASPRGAAAGDLRLGLRVRLTGEELDRGQLALGFYLHAPTGADRSYVSDGSVRFMPHLTAGGRGTVPWSLSLGGDFRGNGNPSALTFGGALGVSIRDDFLQLQAEIYGSTLLQATPFRVTELRNVPRYLFNTQAEILFGARLRPYSGLVAGLSAGPGLTDAFGSPAYRIIGTIAWSPRGTAAPDRDPDRDGITTAEDACPALTGPRSPRPERNGCPLQDRDGDEVDDRDDKCPDRAGVASADPEKDGCPADKDGDKVWDDIDVCPDEPGVDEMNGCPADADRDGVPDAEDACPGEQGSKASDPKTNGCAPKAPPVPAPAVAPAAPAANSAQAPESASSQ